MNHTELKTARKLLCLTAQEAAEFVGGMKTRSWEYLEQGAKKIPDDIVEKMQVLLQRRRDALADAQEKMLREEGDLNAISVIFYENPEHCASILEWRFSQSLAITLAHDYHARLVKFCPKSYTAWLMANGIQADTQDRRAQWAAGAKSK